MARLFCYWLQNLGVIHCEIRFFENLLLLAGELSCQNFKIRFLLGCKIYWPKKETDLGIPGPATDFSSTTASKKV